MTDQTTVIELPVNGQHCPAPCYLLVKPESRGRCSVVPPGT